MNLSHYKSCYTRFLSTYFVVWVCLALIFGGFSNLKAQNKDFHSFDLSMKDEAFDNYLDSLYQLDLSKSLEYSLQYLDKVTYFDDPSRYTKLIYNSILSSYNLSDIELSDSLYIVLNNVSKKNIHPLIYAEILINQSKAARIYSKFMEALSHAKQAQIIYIQNNDLQGELIVIRLIMAIYFQMRDYQLAEEYFLLAINKFSRFTHSKLKLHIYRDGSRILIYLGKYADAAKYLSESQHLVGELDDLTLKATISFVQGLMYYKQENYFKSIELVKQAIAEYKYNNQLLSLSNCLTFLASISMKQLRIRNAEILNQEALNIRLKTKHHSLIASSHYNIASCMIEEARFDSALYYLDRGDSLYSRYTINADNLRGLMLRQKLLVKRKDFKSAYWSLEKMVQLQDSLYSLDNKNAIDNIKSTIEISKFEQQKEKMMLKTKLEKRQNEIVEIILNIVIITLCFAVLISFLLYKYYKDINKRKLIVTNQKMIFIQMNSHFLFNALNAIQSLLYKNKIEDAIHHLTVFSNLVNKIISITPKKYINLQLEVSFILEFIQIQKLRFGDDLIFNLDIDDDIRVANIQTPPLLIYPFIEYAVEECIQQSADESSIHLAISSDSKYIYYKLVDVNLGFSDLDNSFIKRNSGEKINCYHLTMERMSLYNHFYRKRIFFSKTDSKINGKLYPSLNFKIRK